VAIVAVAIAVWALQQREKTRRLKSQFGPEYDRVMARTESPRQAEAILDERQKRVSKFPIRPLSREQCDRFAADWRSVQERFVDNPRSAVSQADVLINEAMRDRGYPISDFEQQAADLSVDHPAVVENYRLAHDIALRDERGNATTEELRRAMQHFRSLFEDVLDMHVTQYEEVRHAK